MRQFDSIDTSTEDDLAGMAGVFNGLALTLPIYLALLAWWLW